MQETNSGTMQMTIPGVIACGLDVHKDKIDACVREGDGSPDGNVIIRTFSTMRKSLLGRLLNSGWNWTPTKKRR